jgi:hypothetical protein
MMHWKQSTTICRQCLMSQNNLRGMSSSSLTFWSSSYSRMLSSLYVMFVIQDLRLQQGNQAVHPLCHQIKTIVSLNTRTMGNTGQDQFQAILPSNDEVFDEVFTFGALDNSFPCLAEGTLICIVSEIRKIDCDGTFFGTTWQSGWQLFDKPGELLDWPSRPGLWSSMDGRPDIGQE